ncbi:MAG: 2-C-methyl-D-erythritol 4-phosphate cytidylyltransferase [Firmicutes bacterium]|nr:2-C-methyl-D-erythritol 4-phosphate cytidylyltransferase [Bacillota bacterium]
MEKVVALIPAAGLGRRMGEIREINKQYLPLGGHPALALTLKVFQASPLVDQVVPIVRSEEIDYCRRWVVERYGLDKATRIVAGGPTRGDSVANGLAAIAGEEWDLIVVHDGARPLLTEELLGDVIEAAKEAGAAVAAVPVKDTIKRVDSTGLVLETLPRNELWAIQTPQAFRAEVLREAYARAREEDFQGTDDASLVERLGLPVAVVRGSYANLKLTTPEDVIMARSFLIQPRVGAGYDVHRLVPGRKLILGGVTIPYSLGLLGHSDADVLVHAIMDALLGAAALGDIGALFPDTDPAYRGASSLLLLKEVGELLRKKGAAILNIDAVVVAQAPKLAPYINQARENIAQALSLPAGKVSIKATTTEGLGAMGRGEGIAAWAVALLDGVVGE